MKGKLVIRADACTRLLRAADAVEKGASANEAVAQAFNWCVPFEVLNALPREKGSVATFDAACSREGMAVWLRSVAEEFREVDDAA